MEKALFAAIVMIVGAYVFGFTQGQKETKYLPEAIASSYGYVTDSFAEDHWWDYSPDSGDIIGVSGDMFTYKTWIFVQYADDAQEYMVVTDGLTTETKSVKELQSGGQMYKKRNMPNQVTQFIDNLVERAREDT